MAIRKLIIGLIFVSGAIAAHSAQKLALADPFILCYDSKYYAYGTSDANGIVVYTSDDLRYWTKQQNLALHKNNSYADRWFWAPEVYYLNGRFYMYYSADEHICVATSDSPLGPFVQDVQEPMLPDKAIDNSLFIDDNGQAYLFFVRFTDGNAVWMAELESDYKTIRTGTMKLCFAAQLSGWEADMGKINEGPFVVKHNGWYYLTYSANHYQSQNYGVGFAYTFDLSGNWSKYSGNPVLQKPNGLFGTGHHCLFRDKDNNLKMAFHAHKSESVVNPRETYITAVEFTIPTRGMSILTVSPDWQAAYIYDPNSIVPAQSAASGAKIVVTGNCLKVDGEDVRSVSLYTLSGTLSGRKGIEPFSFTLAGKGCYLSEITYKNNLTEKRKIII